MIATPLPIDPLLPEIVETLRRANALVLEAPPGAGKTTRVPRALLEAGVAGGKEIIVLQPRRLPTRLAARRVADEMGERLGETVGYQVRFEDIGGAKTRLRFVTEGVLGRRMLSDPLLRGVGIVVLDEFHERHLASDVSLAMLRELQRGARPDLKLAVMSATLDAEPIAAYLGGAPRLRSEGRRFQVEIEHLPQADDRYLDQQVLAALKRVAANGLDGHVLVFLPGAGEIRRATESCAEFAQRHGLEVHALHGDLPPAEQDRAVQPSAKHKLILSTNVAETSVTIDGIAAVIDSGLARVASHSAWSGMPVLNLAKVSQASATQRAGRAGRTREGRCLRLYTQHDFAGRPDHDAPEIRRVDLSETVLSLRATGVRDLRAFPFFEAPPTSALEAAEKLLGQLGAIDGNGITELGRRLLRFPLHPRQARVIVEGERRGVAEDAAIIAATLGERELRSEARTRFGSSRGGKALSGPSDLLDVLERFRAAEADGMSRRALEAAGLENGAAQAVDRVRRQLGRLLDRSVSRPSPAAVEEALLISALAGFPDRVARRRKPHAPELVLAGGGSAVLSETSVVAEPDLLIAADAEERGQGRGARVVVRLASKVEPEWLLELCADQISDLDERVWNAEARRVDRVTRLALGNISLEETRAPAPPSPETARVLVENVLSRGWGAIADAERLAEWRSRVELVARAIPTAGLPTDVDAFLRSVLERQSENTNSATELERLPWLELFTSELEPAAARALQNHAPDRVTLPSGRVLRIHYEASQPPWVESRLQDFFGSKQGPTIGQGRVPLVLHLLAPNQRPVQVTTDLAGFWERHYPAIRRELMRRYPRHPWPEDPTTAAPPAPRR